MKTKGHIKGVKVFSSRNKLRMDASTDIQAAFRQRKEFH